MTNTYTYKYTHTHTHLHTHIYTHTHVYPHVHTHTHKQQLATIALALTKLGGTSRRALKALAKAARSRMHEFNAQVNKAHMNDLHTGMGQVTHMNESR